QKRRPLDPSLLVLRREDAQQRAQLTRRDPPRGERLRRPRQLSEAAIHVEQVHRAPAREAEALGDVVGQTREPELEITRGAIEAAEQPRETQLERIAHRRQAPEVTIEQEPRQI